MSYLHILGCYALQHTVNTQSVDLGTKRQWQNAIAQIPNSKNACPNPKTPTPKPQTHKSVAFHTLAFFPWHSDQIPSQWHWSTLKPPVLPVFFNTLKCLTLQTKSHYNRCAGSTCSLIFVYHAKMFQCYNLPNMFSLWRAPYTGSPSSTKDCKVKTLASSKEQLKLTGSFGTVG